MRSVRVVAAAAAAWLACACAGDGPEPGAEASRVGAELRAIIVVLRDGAGDVDRRASALAAAHRASVGHTWHHALRGFSATVPAGAVAALCAEPEVARCDDDLPVQAFCHDDPFQVVPSGVARVGARDNLLALGPPPAGAIVGVAVLDTGVDGKSRDLVVARAWNCATRKGGCVELSSASDDNGHGTHVAGTIAAVDDGDRVVGVAPWAAVYSVKVLDRTGSGRWSWILNGLDLVAVNADAIAVANLSLGGASGDDPSRCESSSLHLAACNVVGRGVVLAVAAGNESGDASDYVPAKYEQVVTVSALDDATGALAGFSNFGPAVDLAAPGVSILSLAPSSRNLPGGGCATMSGTSMAAPHVAGAALLWTAAHGRDCDGDGQVGAADPPCVARALALAGECPGGGAVDPATSRCEAAFAGDGDGFAEPLVFVASPF